MVLLSEQLDSVVRPVVNTLRLGDVELVANSLEIKNGLATGALTAL